MFNSKFNKTIALLPFTLICMVVSSQVYIPIGKSVQASEVTIKYKKGASDTRPSMGIYFSDGFSMFEHVLPVCPGDYPWCLRNKENNDIASLRLNFLNNKLFILVKLDPAIKDDKSKNEILKHINLLKGTFVMVK
jgi:hypothetical protein